MSETIESQHDTHPVDMRSEAAIFLGSEENTGAWFAQWRKAHYDARWSERKGDEAEQTGRVDEVHKDDLVTLELDSKNN
jgi:hypothetical protein